MIKEQLEKSEQGILASDSKPLTGKFTRLHVLAAVMPQALLTAASVLLWSVLAIRAITQMDMSWDSLAYHLPFASRWAGIFPKSGFLFYVKLEPLFLGGPKLGEFMQGMLWRATGMISAANLFGLICIVIVTIIACKRLRLPFWLVTLFFLSIPLVLIQTETSYTDLPANSFLVLAFVNLVVAVDEHHFDSRTLFFVLLPLCVAANIKFQAIEVAVPFWIAALIIFVVQNRRQLVKSDWLSKRKYLGGLLLANMLAALLFGANYVSNLVRFHNPVYPLSVRIGPLSLEGPFPGTINIDGPLSISRESPNQTQSVGTAPSHPFETYLLSLSELPLWTKNSGRLWSIDQGEPWIALPSKDPISKTGGYFVANLLLWGSFLALSAAYGRSRRALFWLLFILGNFIFVGLLPAGKILRYWLFLPLELAILALWAYKSNPDRLKPVFSLVLTLQFAIFAFVAYQTQSTVFPSVDTYSHLQEGVQNLAGTVKPYKLEMKSSSYVCIVSHDSRLGFLYKLANPELPIQGSRDQSSCEGTTIILPK